VGALLLLMFMQRLIFGGFEALLVLFNLSRVGLDAADNGIVFAFVGIILVVVQGRFIGPWCRRFGEHRLINAGLGLIAVGLILTALTPEVPVPWYSPETILETANMAGEASIAVPLPDADHAGWLGFIWLLVAMIPAAIGGGIVRPSINSLITQRTDKHEVGGILGVSSSLVSLANAITPLVGGLIFQQLGSTAPFLIGGIIMAVLCGVSFKIVQPTNELTVLSV
jgi:DHA1 family tetracycline resistance protein-like MFS transporter